MSEPNINSGGLTSPNQEDCTVTPTNEHIQRTEGAFPLSSTVQDDNGHTRSAAPMNGKLFNDPSIAKIGKKQKHITES
jgi:hypothetical protein